MSLFDTNRGRIPSPDLDDREWKDIVDQTIALIPKYAPQWTDHGPSDIGITLVELFAWLVEGLIFRLNQVPEKNYAAFLNLLGITRNPPEPARAFLTFSARSNPQLTVPKGTQAQTAPTETGEPFVFETDEDVEILPLDLKAVIRIAPDGSYTNLSASFTAPPAKGQMLTIPAGGTISLCFGFDAANGAQVNPTTRPINLMFRFFDPISKTPHRPVDAPSPRVPTVEWRYSDDTGSLSALPRVDGVSDGTRGLQNDGVVTLTMPPRWTMRALSDWDGVHPAANGDTVVDACFWIALVITNASDNELPIGFERILFNAVSAHSALTITAPEPLGTSNGAPFQVFPLANGPLFRQPGKDAPYSHLRILVNDAPWTPVDDFPQGEGNVYRLDPVAAEISFGNYDGGPGEGHGSIPPDGASIVAETYRYVVGGAAANVGGGSIIALRKQLKGIDRVTNVFAAYGGADQEPIENAKRRAPELLRNRNRAVTKEDYEFLAMQASTELATVRCLGPTYEQGSGRQRVSTLIGGMDRSAGNVNVIIVPAQGLRVSPKPKPSPELIQEVQAYLDRRRDVATRLQVQEPRYLPINVTISASAWERARAEGQIRSPDDVRQYIETRLKQYLHPVTGGLEGQGWQIGQNIFIADMYKAIMPPENWGFISSLKIEAGTTDHTRPPVPESPGGARVQLADFELVCEGVIDFGAGVNEI